VIEELRDYLVRLGIADDVADDIHDAYLDGDMKGVCQFSKTLEDDEHDYTNEITQHILSWRREVGECSEHTNEFVVESASLVDCLDISNECVKVKGWYVDVTTYCGKLLRYTVLGRTPYAIPVKEEAIEFIEDVKNDLIDDGSWTILAEKDKNNAQTT